MEEMKEAVRGSEDIGELEEGGNWGRKKSKWVSKGEPMAVDL